MLLAVAAQLGLNPGTARGGHQQLAPASARAGPAMGLYESFWDEEASFAQRLEKFAFPVQEVPQILKSAHSAVHDFYQINASARGKALAEACGVIDLPTAQIYASGLLALTHSVANKEFRNFEAGFSEQASVAGLM